MIYPSYTATLKSLVDNGFDLGLRDYPIWDEAHRSVLNNKIIHHYMFREIGFETPAMFKFYLNRTLDEIMPYYNKLYETTVYDYDPIANVNYTESTSETRVGNIEGTSSAKSKGVSVSDGDNSVKYESTSENTTSNTSATNGKNVDVDTPQSVLDVTDIDRVAYASNVKFNKDGSTQNGRGSDKQDSSTSSSSNSTTKNDNDSSTSSVTDSKESNEASKHVQGSFGVTTTQRMIEQERQLIINIDMMIVEELNNCFMNLW